MKQDGPLNGDVRRLSNSEPGARPIPTPTSSNMQEHQDGRLDLIQKSVNTIIVFYGCVAKPSIGARNGPLSGRTILIY